MEVDDEDSQICRLCGQYENMVIDVFGEEGKKRLLGMKIHSKINILIKPDDGLPHVVCMRCIGTLEFLCDFHEMCHSTQKDLESSNKKESTNQTKRDAESDKENELPVKTGGKRKAKTVQSETIKLQQIDNNEEIINNTEIPNNQTLSDSKLKDKSDNTCSNTEHVVDLDISQKPIDHGLEKDKSLTSPLKTVNLESPSKESEKSDNNLNINEKKSTNKNKTQESKLENIIIDKNVSNKLESKENSIENSKCANTENDKTKIVFEGTIMSSTDNQSILMPLNVDTFSGNLRLDTADMVDSSQIVQASEILWITNNTEILKAEKPKSSNFHSKKVTSPAPGDEAEIINDTVTMQSNEEGINLTAATDQVILLEVQLPENENKVLLNTLTNGKRKRCLSNASKTSDNKFAKISELITEEERNTIETLYTIDMSCIDDQKVGKELIVIDKNKFKCNICNSIYPRLDKCQVHIWRHLNMKPYLCKECDFSTLTVSNIRCHIRKSHLKIKPFECHLCHKRYNSSGLLEEHLNIHTGTRPFECNNCDFASASKQVLAHHILTHKTEKDITCDVCGRAFYSKGRMRAHRMTHTKDKAFKCKLCHTYVLHEEALERHYVNVHAQDYVCSICNKVYKSKKALHNHENVHSDAKHKCPMCPNMYKSSHILKEHILKHKGIRQYKCNICNKSFAQQSHLAAHTAVHSGVMYNCPGCNKGFNRHDNMKVHAKRCELFQANPGLQDLLIKRKINYSKNDTARIYGPEKSYDQYDLQKMTIPKNCK